MPGFFLRNLPMQLYYHGRYEGTHVGVRVRGCVRVGGGGGLNKCPTYSGETVSVTTVGPGDTVTCSKFGSSCGGRKPHRHAHTSAPLSNSTHRSPRCRSVGAGGGGEHMKRRGRVTQRETTHAPSMWPPPWAQPSRCSHWCSATGWGCAPPSGAGTTGPCRAQQQKQHAATAG
jgi:hypothetical protein